MLADELRSVLEDDTGERTIARFLRENPKLVVWGFCSTGGHSKYVLHEFPFGSKNRCDLVVPLSYSGVWKVNFIELEPVSDRIFTKKGNPSQRLNGAISQVKDWQDYIRLNRASIQRDLSEWCQTKDLLRWHGQGRPPCNQTNNYLKDASTHIRFKYHIIIGRRSQVTDDVRRRINQYCVPGEIEIGTYDRFLDIAQKFDQREENPELSVFMPSTKG